MDLETARQHAATGARYVNYCKHANPDPESKGWADFHAALAMAVSYPFLDLRDLTPAHLIEPMLERLRDWRASNLSANTLSAQDRLNGLYGICANCGEFTPREIGGLKKHHGMPHYATGEHVCNGCRLDLMVTSVFEEIERNA